MIVPLLQPLIAPPHLPTHPTLCSFFFKKQYTKGKPKLNNTNTPIPIHWV